MFEKEAEEYKKEHIHYDEGREQHYYDVSFSQAFKDGAEFGYNKANEWHDLRKDPNDLPKEYDTVLACTEFEQQKSCLICNYHYQKWWYADGKYDEYVIAWKEIVLPKESE